MILERPWSHCIPVYALIYSVLGLMIRGPLVDLLRDMMVGTRAGGSGRPPEDRRAAGAACY